MKLEIKDLETDKTVFKLICKTPEDLEFLEWLFAILRHEEPPFGRFHLLKLALKKKLRLLYRRVSSAVKESCAHGS